MQVGDISIQNQLKEDFEKYMQLFYKQHNRFTVIDFATFAATLLNHYIQNQIIAYNDKKSAANYLTTLFNYGMGNRIQQEHLDFISQTIMEDNTVDFNVLKVLFG